MYQESISGSGWVYRVDYAKDKFMLVNLSALWDYEYKLTFDMEFLIWLNVPVWPCNIQRRAEIHLLGHF